MPPISPYLDDLLTRWIKQSNDLRKEAVFQRELLEPLALTASGNRLAMRERHRRTLEHMELSMGDAQARWEERLHRIEQWGKNVSALQDEEAQLRRLIQSTVWLQKARAYQDTFTHRLEKRAGDLDAEQHALHEKLEAWLGELKDRENQLQELNAKKERSDRPVFVSRARKQPEVDFVNQQLNTQDLLGRDMQALRRSLHQVVGRLQKAFAAIEFQAAGQEILYEVHKQEIFSALKGTEAFIQERRERILSDALVYEACRSSLRRLQNIAGSLRCIEDIPKSNPRGWKKFFQIH